MNSNQNDQKSGGPDNSLAAAGSAESGVTKTPQSSASHNGSKTPQPMDRWFDDQLNQLFNDVSSEPLPADLANLISQLKAQGQKT